MKISNKEKIMLCVLGIILVGIGYYNLIYTPLIKQVEQKSSEKIETENKYNTAMETIAQLENRKSDIKILKAKISDRSQAFYPTISEEHIILELDKLLNDSGLTGGITFEPIVSQSVENSEKENVNLPESSIQGIVDKYSTINPNSSTQKNKSNEDTQNEVLNSSQSDSTEKTSSDIDSENSNNTVSSNQDTNTQEKKENTVQYLKCSVNFKGTYEGLNTFLKTIGENEKKIVVNSINIGQDSLSGINGTMKLEIYSIPKINDEIKSYLKWTLNNTYGKTVPFNTGAATGVETSEKDSSDFVVAAKSINSDLPTVIMGKANDEERITYVYADNNGVEDAELILTQNGDKYYYKYKTSKGNYPKDYSGNGAQFAPISDGKISIDIMSEGRLNSDDKSGIKLKITNNTNMLVNVNVSDDDKNNQRVTVDGNSSKISVNQK